MKSHGMLVVVTALVFSAGCGGDGPQGPGDLPGTVEVGSAEIGAIVVNVSGVGIGAIKGTGSTRAFASDDVSNSKRVVLVIPQAGGIGFTVSVEDRSLGAPTATVVEAVDLNNQPVTNLAGISVRITVQ
jgi:hypothetical protein